MAKQTINIGASPNDGTGTPLRTSFDYCNLNFTELYTALGGGVGLPGATTQVIFNDGGTNLAGDAGLVYNKTTDALTVGGLVTAGSATITGALSAGGNSVIGTGSVQNAAAGRGNLTIGGTTGAILNLSIGNADTGYIQHDATDIYFSNRIAAGSLFFQTNSTTRYRIASDGVATWSNVGGVASTAMTLNANGLGVGIVPSSFGRFSVQGTAGGAGILGMNTDATQCDIQSYNKPLAINRAGNNITMCEGGGNVGIGVTTPDFKFVVNGTQAVPATSGSATDNGSLRIGAPGTGLCIDSGVTAATDVYAWFQARSRSNYATNFNLVFNPNGGNVGIGYIPTAGSLSKVLFIGTGTEPTAGATGAVQYFTSTRSASNTIPAILCEGSGVTNAGITSTTVTNKIAIKVNGTIYYLLATTSAA